MIISLDRSRFRSAVVMVAVAVLAVAAAVAIVMRSAIAEAAEDDGANCAVTLPGSVASNSRLPDPFRKLDGTRITAKSQWQCRRAEIKELAERYVYGDKPAKPTSVTGTVSSSSITVNVSHNGRSASFSASVQLPTGSGPFPAVVVLGGFGADTATIRAAGAAVINYDPLAVGREGTPRNNKQGAFYTIYGNTSSTGLLAAWAWGVSRIIDVIEQSGGNILRADATGVTGCSRYGKGAFVIGAFDQRIALTMPIESGSAGAPIFRGIPGESGAQPLSSAYGEQPWLGDAFGSFTGNPNGLPVDTHETVAMIAPRGLLIMENPHIDWLAARSGSVAALGGAEVYRALGAIDNITYWSDIQDGTHCAVRPEWRTPLQQHIQKFLLRTRQHHRRLPDLQPQGRQPGRVAGLADARPLRRPDHPAQQHDNHNHDHEPAADQLDHDDTTTTTTPPRPRADRRPPRPRPRPTRRADAPPRSGRSTRGPAATRVSSW